MCVSIHVLLFPNCIDISTATVWKQLDELEDPELKRLAAFLPDTLLRSRADSTTRKYLGAFRRWKTWADARQDVPAFPVQDIHFALYLQHLGEIAKSKAPVEEAVHAISWVQLVSGQPQASASPIVRATLAGLQRILAQPKVTQGAYFPTNATCYGPTRWAHTFSDRGSYPSCLSPSICRVSPL